MDVQGRQPLLAADDVGGAHEVIVDDVGEVVGRDAVRLEQHDVLVVFRQLDVALDKVAVNKALVRVARASEAQDVGLAGLDVFLNLLECEVAALCPLAVVAEVDLHLLLLLAHLVELLLGAEAWVSKTLLDQHLGKGLVNFGALALAVGAVGALVPFDGGALVKV